MLYSPKAHLLNRGDVALNLVDEVQNTPEVRNLVFKEPAGEREDAMEN